MAARSRPRTGAALFVNGAKLLSAVCVLAGSQSRDVTPQLEAAPQDSVNLWCLSLRLSFWIWTSKDF